MLPFVSFCFFLFLFCCFVLFCLWSAVGRRAGVGRCTPLCQSSALGRQLQDADLAVGSQRG
jgi:hypothetical protein